MAGDPSELLRRVMQTIDHVTVRRTVAAICGVLLSIKAPVET